MYFYYPTWLRHGRPNNVTSIFSVDIQPQGTRLATCGQDCAIKIWHLPLLAELAQPYVSKDAQTADAVRDDGTTTKSQIPPPGALLTTLTPHSAAVNVVRWSPTGMYLASAGDDAVVLVHYRATGSQQSTFGEGRSAENWLHRRPLRAHTSDVTDLTWSPDGERLASASVDNSIIIWNMRTETSIVRLDGHRGLVKGLAWDPVGRFLASQSDDRTVRIWRTSDWKTEKIISEPFETAVFQENSMTFFLRISWSPCGTHLIATNAYRKPGTHHAPMFSRQNGFDNPIEFVGHREPVISSRFSPRLYRAHPQINNELKEADENENTDKPSIDSAASYTVLSLGAKDGGCTVWQAKATRPFFEMYDAFDMEVIDMSWGSDGYTMVACSTDGKVLYLRYEPKELGVVLPHDEARAILTEVWRSLGGSATGGDAPLPESAVQLRMEAAGEAERTKREDERIDVPPGINPPPGATVMDTGAASMGNGTNVLPSRVAPSTLPAPANKSGDPAQQNEPTPPADPKIIAAQAEVRVRGGKRRITPISVAAVDNVPFEAAPPAMHVAPSSSPFQPMLMEVPESVPAPTPSKRPRNNPDPNDAHVNDGRVSFARHTSVLAGAVNGAQDGQPIDGMTNGTAVWVDHHRLTLVPPNARPVSHAASLYQPSVIGLSMMLLPERGNEGPGRCRVIREGDAMITLESREQLSGGSGFVVTCSEGGKVMWRDYHPRGAAVTALAGVYGKFVAVATSDGTLYLYSATSGRRLAPPIALDSAPYILETFCFAHDDGDEDMGGSIEAYAHNDERWFVIVVTRSAMCATYDARGKKMICARSVAPLLARPQESETSSGPGHATRAKIVREISHCEVTCVGEPIVCLSDGHAFVYSRDLCSWLRVADDSLPNSEFRRTVNSSSKVGILRSLQSGSGLRQKGVGSLSGMGDLRRAAVESLAHLESLMEAAIVLRSATDYRYYLTNYATRIASAVNDDVESCMLRLRELCDDLLNVAVPSKDKLILGMSCRKLLKETVLPVVSANRNLQRFVSEYSESLREVEKLASSSHP